MERVGNKRYWKGFEGKYMGRGEVFISMTAAAVHTAGGSMPTFWTGFYTSICTVISYTRGCMATPAPSRLLSCWQERARSSTRSCSDPSGQAGPSMSLNL